jgi:predicted PurR-regulated permease PerM
MVVHRAITIELSWRAIFRVLLAAVLVWCVMRVTWLFLVVLVATLLAVTLDPVVRLFEAKHFPRWAASSVVVLLLAGTAVGLGVAASSQLSDQAQTVGARIVDAERFVIKRLPARWIERLGGESAQQTVQTYVSDLLMRVAQGLTAAMFTVVIGVILTLYFLIEGRRTYAWLIAFVPPRLRGKTALTAIECQRVIFGYVAGNVATSAFAFAVVYIALTLLRVPAALLLAVVAGVCDFVPVLGFAISSVPAILLALTVSPGAAVTVAAIYIGYHTLENYIIAPFIYGGRLRLSNVAIVLSFAIGAELGGIVGAVIALPLAAAYPAIERIWLRDKLGDQVVDEHAEIEGRQAAPIPRRAAG